MPTSILDRVRAALKRPSPTIPQLADALADARKADADALAAVERQVEAVAAGYLDSADKRAAARSHLADLRAEAEDAAAILAETERRHAAALAAEEQVRRQAVYDGARADGDAASADLAKAYPKLAGELVGLMGRIARAQQRVAVANAELPDGAAPLPDPEMAVRGTLYLPEETVSEEEVTLWTREGSFTPEPAEAQAVIKDVGKGWGCGPGQHEPHFRQRRYVKRLFHKAVFGFDPVSLADGLNLPPARHGAPLWEASGPGETRDPAAVLGLVAAIDAAAVAVPVKATRPLKVEWVDRGEVHPLPLVQALDDAARSRAAPGSRFSASPFAAPGSRPARRA